MSRTEELRPRADYYTIKEGSFRLPSTKEDPKALARDYVNPRTSEKGVAYELGFGSIYGFIRDVKFQDTTLDDGKVLRRLNIVLDESEGGKPQVITMDIDSRYAEDFLKRLPNIDLEKEVQFRPYDYSKNGQRKMGLGLQHENSKGEWIERIEDFFTKVTEADGKKVFEQLHGFPAPTQEDREDWKFYFQKVNKFLVRYTKDNVLPKFGKARNGEGSDVAAQDASAKDQAMEAGLDEAFGSDPDKIPF